MMNMESIGKKMKIKYDKKIDAAYIYLFEEKIRVDYTYN